MPISMKTGLLALMCLGLDQHADRAGHAGRLADGGQLLSSIVLAKVSEAPFWTTVKSAFPTEMIAAADCSRPLLVTSRVTTAITAMATAKVRPRDRAFLDKRLRMIRSKNVIRVRSWKWPETCLRLGDRGLPLGGCCRIGHPALGSHRGEARPG